MYTSLVVTVQPPRGHVAQVQRRRTQPPHALGDRGEAPEEGHGVLHPLTIVREAGDHQRGYHLVRDRYPYGLAVEGGAVTALRGEGLPSYGIVHHPQGHLSFSL